MNVMFIKYEKNESEKLVKIKCTLIKSIQNYT